MLRLWIGIVIGFLAALPASAEVSFEAEVTADAEAENSAKARETAIIQAQKNALSEVAGRLTSSENAAKLEELNTDQFLHFIQAVTVISENHDQKSYHATLKILINGELLKQYLQENNLLSALPEPEEILIIPTYAPTGYGQKILWEDTNVWYQAWAEKGKITHGVFDFKIIDNTPDYMTLVNATSFDQPNEQLYRQLAGLSHTSNIYIVQAVQAGFNTLAVVIKSLPVGKEKRIVIFDQNGNVFNQAIDQAVADISEDIKTQQSVNGINQQSLLVVYEYERLKDLLETERLIRSISQVKALNTGTATNGKVQMNIDYTGHYQNFVNALGEHGFYLFTDNGKYILKKEIK